MNVKAIIVPGNGNNNPEDKWFPYLARELGKLKIRVINVKFPDAVLARKHFWLPFLEEKLGTSESTILIGHSSGAVATMRYAETHKILGSVLVAAYITDLGEHGEKISGYFDGPWRWKDIKNNQKWIVQFASSDDPYIEISEAREIHHRLHTDYHEYTDQGHFGKRDRKIEFPEIVEIVQNKLQLETEIDHP